MGKEGGNEEQAGEGNKRRRLVRSFPASTLKSRSILLKLIFDFGSGQAVRRLTIFDHLGKSPESGASRQLITNASRVLSDRGDYAAEHLRLTEDD